MERYKTLPSILIVSENEKSLSDYKVDNKNLEKHDARYTDYLMSFFSRFSKEVVLIDSLEELPEFLKKNRDFIVFSVWSGANSRNRMSLAPAICESFNTSYIGADSYAKTICQDKFISRSFAKRIGFSIPDAILIEGEEHFKALSWLNYPVVAKPNMEGTSIGIRKFKEEGGIEDALRLMLNKYDNSVLVEEFIYGREVAILIFGSNSNPKVLGAVEVVSEGDNDYFLDNIFDTVEKKSGVYKRLNISKEISEETYELAKKAYKGLGKMDFLRIDGRLTLSGEFYFIEFSPIPNFSKRGSIAALSNNKEDKRILVAKELIELNLPQA